LTKELHGQPLQQFAQPTQGPHNSKGITSFKMLVKHKNQHILNNKPLK
jgi:hypothetical protein